jgi:hypothetical protein
MIWAAAVLIWFASGEGSGIGVAASRLHELRRTADRKYGIRKVLMKFFIFLHL